MLAAILAFAIAIVTGLSTGPSDVPMGLNNPSLPSQASAGQHSQAIRALAESGRPTTVPANDEQEVDTSAPEDAPANGDQENKPTEPVVDTENAPEVIDLGNVPAQDNEHANVPDTVGANENANLPDQAGGSPGDNGGGNSTSACAKSAKGNSASDC